MQVVLHAGVHTTDEGRLSRCLLRNRDRLHGASTAVPPLSRFRRSLRDAIQALAHHAPDPGAKEALLARILDQDPPERLVLSNHNFFCVPKLAIGQGQFYPHAETKLADFRELFEGDQPELFLAIRNPATFLPDVFAASPYQNFDQFMGGTDPLALRWSEFFLRIRQTLPDLPITVWCHEDAPLAWGAVMQAMAGIEGGAPLDGEFDLLADIISPAGMRRLQAYLQDRPALNDAQRRRAAALFLEKYALEDALVEELDGPDWDDLMIDMLTEVYEEDVHEIARLPNLRLITP